MYRSLKKRIRLARRFARRPHLFDEGSDDTGIEGIVSTILDLLSPAAVVEHDEDIIVTEVGFVTMALVTAAASYQQELLVIPGVDDHVQTGFLVLRESYVPYHSLAKSAAQAAVETGIAHARAAELVAHFGSRPALKHAALSAPWYLISRVEDVSSAGLCEWGSDSFLRRHGLIRIAYCFGLPRIALRLAGNYGNRITAATLRRQKNAVTTCTGITSEQ